MKIALAQMCSGLDWRANAEQLRSSMSEAASNGAEILFTPEMTGILDRDRSRLAKAIAVEEDDPFLAEARELSRQYGIWLQLGSLAVKTQADPNQKWANRSFLIDPDGNIVARYDKIHLFDIDLGSELSMRESAAYTGGKQAVVAPFENKLIGLSICYDLRFAGLFEAQTNAGAQLLSVPAAFTVPTGKAHWETLLRARAIESGVFVVAAAQCGTHEDGRATWGHSMIIGPWGAVRAHIDGDTPGIICADINLTDVAEARRKIPAWQHDPEYSL